MSILLLVVWFLYLLLTGRRDVFKINVTLTEITNALTVAKIMMCAQIYSIHNMNR